MHRSEDEKCVEYEGRIDVVFKGLIAAAASVALMATPAMAAGSAPAELAPASESIDGLQMDGGGSAIVIVLALIAAGVGIWLLVDKDNDDSPASP